jgi:TPP-dependent pyruvate/acetoin dehydrogenase alpha subunit
MRQREPVTLATTRVLDEGILNQDEIDQIIADAETEIAGIEKFADESDIARPPEAELLADVFAP